jgi:hypothetical protein
MALTGATKWGQIKTKVIKLRGGKYRPALYGERGGKWAIFSRDTGWILLDSLTDA